MAFLHPTHNFALVRYDPSRFEPGKVKSAVLWPEPVEIGDRLEFVGLCRSNPDTCVAQEMRVSEISSIHIPMASVPRFRAVNEEIAKFDEVRRAAPNAAHASSHPLNNYHKMLAF